MKPTNDWSITGRRTVRQWMVPATLLLTTPITPALAHDDRPRTIVVSAADLDLSSEAGRRSLDRRIRRAADKVCDSGYRPRYPIANRCVSSTVASVRPDRDRILAAHRPAQAVALLRNDRTADE